MQARQTAVLAISLAQTNVPNVPLPTNTDKCFVKDRFVCSIGLQLCHNFGGPLCSRNTLHIVLTLGAATSPVGSRLQSRWFPLILPAGSSSNERSSPLLAILAAAASSSSCVLGRPMGHHGPLTHRTILVTRVTYILAFFFRWHKHNGGDAHELKYGSQKKAVAKQLVH